LLFLIYIYNNILFETSALDGASVIKEITMKKFTVAVTKNGLKVLVLNAARLYDEDNKVEMCGYYKDFELNGEHIEVMKNAGCKEDEWIPLFKIPECHDTVMPVKGWFDEQIFVSINGGTNTEFKWFDNKKVEAFYPKGYRRHESFLHNFEGRRNSIFFGTKRNELLDVLEQNF